MTEEGTKQDVLADVRKSCLGDGAAFARIIRRYQQPLTRRMARFAHGRADTEELVHEVFVAAYFSLPRFRHDAPFEHWLARIATRTGFRYWKRKKANRKLAGESLAAAEHVAAVDAGEALAPAEAAQTLALLLDTLSPRDRLAITLLHIEGRSVQEAADLTGWSRTMVKVQAFRARRKLKAAIEKTKDRQPATKGIVP